MIDTNFVSPNTEPTLEPQEPNIIGKVFEAATWATLGAVTVGALAFSASDGERPAGENAVYNLEHALNSGDHVAEDITVAVGYQIPFHSEEIRGAVAIQNPIKFDSDTYGYVVINHETGKVDVQTVNYDKPLQVIQFGGHSDAYPHEVITSVATIYDDYSYYPEGPQDGRYFSVIMGEKAGDAEALVNTAPNIDEAEYLREVNLQMGELAEARVGDLVYYGK